MRLHINSPAPSKHLASRNVTGILRPMQSQNTGSARRPPEAFHTANLFETGMGHVVVSRFKQEGTLVEAGVFLLDVYCLGVKDAFFTQVGPSEYKDRFLPRVFAQEPGEPMDPSCARKLVEQAIAYAAKLGFAPHPDYKRASRVFGGILWETCPTNFVFGHKGKPFYIRGPYDTEARANYILQQLQRRCGEGNYDYVVALGAPSDFEGLLED